MTLCTVTRDDIAAARVRIRPHALRTPMLSSPEIDAAYGAEVFFKCENLQRTGSFKIRGACNAVFSLSDDEASRGVATHSSGNHGQALAFAARLRGIPAWVVVPSDAPAVKRDAVAAYGAEVVECAPGMEARQAALADVLRRTGATFVHPYDDDRVIAGQATAAAEMLEDRPELDIIVAPVSGGGLLSGTSLSARLLSRGTETWGAEPEGADDAARSLAEGRPLPQRDPRTMADGLRASLSQRTFEVIQANAEGVVTVSEESIAEAMRILFSRLKLVVEPSGAVSFAALEGGRMDVRGKRVGVVISGGNVANGDFCRIVNPPGPSP